MAKKEKNITNAKDADLKQEKLQRVSFKQFIKDERTHKITGSLFVLLAVLLFVSFTSYLSTWDEDQDKLISEGSKLFWGTDTEVANLMGTFGAFVAHLFMFKGFGVASYLFCGFFFVIGVNLIFSKSVFSVVRNLRYLIVGLPLFSITASALFAENPFPWGGAVGDLSKQWLFKIIGTFGTFAVIFIAFWAYIIWRFNPSFNKLMQGKKNKAEDVDIVPVVETPEPVKPKKDKKEDAKLFIETGVEEKDPNVAFVEKEEAEPVEEDLGIDDIIQELPNNTQGLELEIKTVEPEIKEEAEPEKKVSVTPYDPILDLRDYKFPTLDLLENHGSEKIVQDPQELENNKNQIINTLKNYDISIQKISATVGPTVTLYEIIPAAGVRISRIKNLEDDIALSLAALGIRIIAPIPGKGTIGIEVPNAKKTIVSMKTLLSADKFTKNNFALPIAIGKKIDNDNFIVDLANMPHLLMAGATGQGKSVGLNAILVSLLYSKHPSQLKFVLVDPKKVELSIYKTIERHFLAKLPGEEDAIITDTKKVVHTLNALCIEMDNRYDLLKEAGCRNIREYNEKFAERKLNPEKGHQFLPFIVLVVDEFADLIMTAGKEVEMPIARLAQLARAVGIHLIIATQRPSVNIITGTIKANFPARIAFKVSSKIDSRTILDAGGAEQLIGKGDMLINYNGEIVRLQCAFVDTPEVDKIVDFIGDQRGYPQAFMLPEYIDEKDADGKDFDVNDKDALFEDAARLIVSSQSGSTSLLQRRMKLGYNRAGRLMDQLEAAGIVGASQGSKVRDVLVKTEADLQEMLNRLF